MIGKHSIRVEEERYADDVKFWQNMIKVKDIWQFGYDENLYEDDDEEE